MWNFNGDSEEIEVADAEEEATEEEAMVGLMESMSSALIEPEARLLALRGALWMKGQAVW